MKIMLNVVSCSNISLSGPLTNVWERSVDGGAFAPLPALNPNSGPTYYEDDDITPGHTYVYRMKFVGDAGPSLNYSNETVPITVSKPVPSDPTGLTATLL